MNARDHELFDAYCIAVVRGNSAEEKRLAAELERREKARQDKHRVRGGVDIRMVRSDVAERMTEMWNARMDVKEYLRLRQKLLETVTETEDTDKTTQDDEETEEEESAPPPQQQQAAKKKTAQVKVINLVTTPQPASDPES